MKSQLSTGTSGGMVGGGVAVTFRLQLGRIDASKRAKRISLG